MHRTLLLPAVLLGAVVTAHASPVGDARVHTFDDETSLGPWTLAASGEAAQRMPRPKLADGRLSLLESWWESTATAALPAPSEETTDGFEVDFTLVMNTGTEGCGFVWLDTARYGVEGDPPPVEAWEAPSLAGSFGVGFDALDPVNRDPFRGSGNTYDRPQHLVSLHFDGLELVKRRTTTEFRDEQPHAVRIAARFVTGGALVDVSLDDEVVFADRFVPRMTAYVGRPAFGARNGETAGDVMLDDVSVRVGSPIPPPPAPLEIAAITCALNDAHAARHAAQVDFPEDTDRFGRILCTLRLDQPETRFDPWDRAAHVWIEPEGAPRVELIRYVTPYHRGHEWTVDVSDFRPLLRGRTTIAQECTTYGEGWVVSVTFRFDEGPCARRAVALEPLWSGDPEIGNPDHPSSDFYVPRDVPVPAEATSAVVRSVVTGHGMLPNTDNAGEFMPLGRTLRVDGNAFENTLWKDDNDLNPCRPQGGTWKYDRAGWAPGDVVAPWRVEVPRGCLGDGMLHVEYELDPYLNEARGQTWAPTHRTEAMVVFFEDVD